MERSTPQRVAGFDFILKALSMQLTLDNHKSLIFDVNMLLTVTKEKVSLLCVRGIINSKTDTVMNKSSPSMLHSVSEL